MAKSAKSNPAATQSQNDTQQQNTQQQNTQQQSTQKQSKKQAKQEAKLQGRVKQAKKDLQKAEQKLSKAQQNVQNCQGTLKSLEDQLATLHAGGHAPQAETVVIGPGQGAQGNGNVPQSEGVTAQAALNASTNQFVAEPPVEGRTDVAGDVQQEQQRAQHGETVEAADVPDEIELSLPPAEGRSDIGEEVTASTPATSTQSAATNTSQSEEKQTTPQTSKAETEYETMRISSGEGSIPIETSDEHAWPPPPIREEVAEAIEEEMKQEAHGESQQREKEAGEGDTTVGTQPRATGRRSHRNSANTDEPTKPED